MKEKQKRAKQSISYQKARHERAAFAFITRDINQNTRIERDQTNPERVRQKEKKEC